MLDKNQQSIKMEHLKNEQKLLKFRIFIVQTNNSVEVQEDKVQSKIEQEGKKEKANRRENKNIGDQLIRSNISEIEKKKKIIKELRVIFFPKLKEMSFQEMSKDK